MVLSAPPLLSACVHKFFDLLGFRAGIELTLQYLLVTFPQGENFSLAPYSRRHGKPAPCRSLRRRSSSPKASVNIVKGFRVSSSPFGTRVLRRATLCASPPSSLPIAN